MLRIITALKKRLFRRELERLAEKERECVAKSQQWDEAHRAAEQQYETWQEWHEDLRKERAAHEVATAKIEADAEAQAEKARKTLEIAEQLRTAAIQREQRASAIIDRYKAITDAENIRRQIEICLSKVIYHTEEGAAYAALALYYKDGRFVRTYKCSVCPFYHLTKANVPSRLVDHELVRKDGYADSDSTQSLGSIARFRDPETEERFNRLLQPDEPTSKK